jgi:hypothetical protein
MTKLEFKDAIQKIAGDPTFGKDLFDSLVRGVFYNSIGMKKEHGSNWMNEGMPERRALNYLKGSHKYNKLTPDSSAVKTIPSPVDSVKAVNVTPDTTTVKQPAEEKAVMPEKEALLKIATPRIQGEEYLSFEKLAINKALKAALITTGVAGGLLALPAIASVGGGGYDRVGPDSDVVEKVKSGVKAITEPIKTPTSSVVKEVVEETKSLPTSHRLTNDLTDAIMADGITTVPNGEESSVIKKMRESVGRNKHYRGTHSVSELMSDQAKATNEQQRLNFEYLKGKELSGTLTPEEGKILAVAKENHITKSLYNLDTEIDTRTADLTNEYGAVNFRDAKNPLVRLKWDEIRGTTGDHEGYHAIHMDPAFKRKQFRTYNMKKIKWDKEIIAAAPGSPLDAGVIKYILSGPERMVRMRALTNFFRSNKFTPTKTNVEKLLKGFDYKKSSYPPDVKDILEIFRLFPDIKEEYYSIRDVVKTNSTGGTKLASLIEAQIVNNAYLAEMNKIAAEGVVDSVIQTVIGAGKGLADAAKDAGEDVREFSKRVAGSLSKTINKYNVDIQSKVKAKLKDIWKSNIPLKDRMLIEDILNLNKTIAADDYTENELAEVDGDYKKILRPKEDMFNIWHGNKDISNATFPYAMRLEDERGRDKMKADAFRHYLSSRETADKYGPWVSLGLGIQHEGENLIKHIDKSHGADATWGEEFDSSYMDMKNNLKGVVDSVLDNKLNTESTIKDIKELSRPDALNFVKKKLYILPTKYRKI